MADPSIGDGLGDWHGDCDWKPKLGMGFNYEEKTFEFYNGYGGRVGFSVRRDNVYKCKHTNELISRMFVCKKEVFRRRDKTYHL